jgi:hypothetical protein
MLVIFDFDDTITSSIASWDHEGCLDDVTPNGANEKTIQQLREHFEAGHEVRIVTSRSREHLQNTLDGLDEFGVSWMLSGVHHTDGEWKGLWMSEHGLVPDKFFDDDPLECADVLRCFPDCETVQVKLHPSWDKDV